MEESGD